MAQFKLAGHADAHVSAEKEQKPSSEVFAAERTGQAYNPTTRELAGNNTATQQLSAELHFPGSDINFAIATPQKRRREKCMSRRRGQNGQIVVSGRWYRVRFWIDVDGQETRVHLSEKICPVSGPALLSQSERMRRAREIIATSGADSEELFNRVVKHVDAVTFREQASDWLKRTQTRKRNPVASSTIETWQSCLTKWLNPNIGDLPLAEVHNGALKSLVSKMSVDGLSPKSICNYVQVVKMVVASAVDKEGEERYPRKWNHQFIDLPVVQKDKQNTPCFSSEVMTSLASWKKKRERMLFILSGAAGLRIGEALGIEIDKHVSADFLTISLVQKVRRGKVENRLKNRRVRQIDLHPAIGSLLKEFVGKRKCGFLFCTKTGKPLSPSNIIHRHLHKALKEMNYINPFTGTYKAGHHAFRRFRNTYLRNRTTCPDGVRNFWLGHAGGGMGDLYDKIKEDVQFRKEVAEQSGFGFELPSIVPNVPSFAENVEMENTPQVV